MKPIRLLGFASLLAVAAYTGHWLTLKNNATVAPLPAAKTTEIAPGTVPTERSALATSPQQQTSGSGLKSMPAVISNKASDSITSAKNASTAKARPNQGQTIPSQAGQQKQRQELSDAEYELILEADRQAMEEIIAVLEHTNQQATNRSAASTSPTIGTTQEKGREDQTQASQPVATYAIPNPQRNATTQLNLNTLKTMVKPERAQDLPAFSTLGRKHTIVNMYASWCGPCRQMLPDLVQIKKRFREQVDILVITVDEDIKEAKEALATIPGVYEHLIVAHNPGSEVAEFLEVQAMPTSWLYAFENKETKKINGYKPGEIALYDAFLRERPLPQKSQPDTPDVEAPDFENPDYETPRPAFAKAESH